MSIDYQLYLDTPIPAPLLNVLGFGAQETTESVSRGIMGDEELFTYLVHNPDEDSFTREELKFPHSCRLILSPNIERYESSMKRLVEALNTVIPTTSTARFYMHNELLLLSKNRDQTVLHTTDSEWWVEHIKHISFPYTQR